MISEKMKALGMKKSTANASNIGIYLIEKYRDLQKFVQGEMRLLGYEDKNQVSLEAAAEFLNIKTDDIDFHTARDDSLVSAYLLKKCY